MTDISVPPASVTAARTIDVEDPARGTTIGTIPVLDERAVQELAARARMAQVGWNGAGLAARSAVMDRARQWLIANSERMSKTICDETGKTFEDAQLEISIAAQSLKFWSK